MRNLSLNIAAIISLLGAAACVISGVIYLASGSAMLGLSLIFLGTPVSIAFAVVFDYISESIRRDRIDGKIRSKKDVIDTPWEVDPDHT